MTDLIERLRKNFEDEPYYDWPEIYKDINEAAEEIERLKQLNDDLVRAWNKQINEMLEEQKRQTALVAVRNQELYDSIEDTYRANKEVERLRAALESIAANTCCDRCQEAALVAREALKD